MLDNSRKSASPLTKSKYSKMFISDLDKVSDIEDEPVNLDQETSEMAMQLALIRKRHDKIKELNTKKQLYYEKLKGEVEAAASASALADQDTKTLYSKIELLRSGIEDSKKRHECELLNKKSYLHVLDRMKSDKIAMEIKANSLQISLKSSRNILNIETDKFRKVRETQFQSKVMLSEIKQAVVIDQKRKNERIHQLEKNIKDRQDLLLRREERQKRQFEISEAAANDDKDSQEAKIRESLLLNRMWFMVLRKKLEKESAKAIDIEQAFQRIKAATGLSDMSDIVEKFLTREQSYLSLVEAVDKAEKKLEALKEYNSIAKDKLNEVHYDEGGNNRKVYADIEIMETKLSECYKEYAIIKEKLQKSVISYDQVLNWAQKICKTLEIDLKLEVSPGSRVLESKNALEEVFEIIYNKLEEVTRPLKERQDEAKVALEKFARKKTGDIVNEITAHESLVRGVRPRADLGEIDKDTDGKYSNREKTPELDRKRRIYNE